MKTVPVASIANWHLPALFVVGIPLLIVVVFILLRLPPPVFGEVSVPTDTVDVRSSTDAWTPDEDSLVFLGDIMLARNIEFLSQQYGVSYSFLHLPAIVGNSQLVVANFEASIARMHKLTPSGMMRFSVDGALLPPLARAGVTHVSLANNHALDYGAADFLHTKDELSAVGIQSFGHPTAISSSSVTYLTQGVHRIAIVGLHTLFAPINQADLAATFETVMQESDVQIAYVHWGDEYIGIHNQAQEVLAGRLAALGVDAIIGHHPHVTQDIQLVSGIPVFYSLGNFIFDQYFSDEVQEGLVLALKIGADTITYTLIPVTSIDTRSQPRPMVESERNQFLSVLAAKSELSLQSDIASGKVILPFYLATSSKNSIMAQ